MMRIVKNYGDVFRCTMLELRQLHYRHDSPVMGCDFCRQNGKDMLKNHYSARAIVERRGLMYEK